MNPETAASQLERLVSLCRERGFPLTAQRRVVFDALLARDDHPTAESLYDDVRRRLPEINRATVYRTLDRLVSLGLATRVHRVGLAARFDPNVERHDHAVCIHCGAMEDLVPVPAAEVVRDPAGAALAGRGFEVLGRSVQVQVVCPACRSSRRGADAR
jgi:Fur family peroxide stress response transcriptional regulator